MKGRDRLNYDATGLDRCTRTCAYELPAEPLRSQSSQTVNTEGGLQNHRGMGITAEEQGGSRKRGSDMEGGDLDSVCGVGNGMRYRDVNDGAGRQLEMREERHRGPLTSKRRRT